MAKLSLQFHASRDEIAQFAGRWAGELGLQLATETLGPTYSSSLVTPGDLGDGPRFPERTRRVLLSFQPIDLDGSGPLGLPGANPEALSILLGYQTATELGMSILSAATDDRETLAAWRRIRKSLTNSLQKGARVVNSWTDAEGPVPDHYFSAGAKELADRGVRMTGLNDVLLYTFT